MLENRYWIIFGLALVALAVFVSMIAYDRGYLGGPAVEQVQ